MILSFLIVAGCATRPGPSPSAWRCSQKADAAFQAGDWQTALDGHQQLLTAEPANCLALYHLGYIMGHLGDRVKEVELYQHALDCGYKEDDQLFFNLGMAYGDLGDLKAAQAALENAVTLDPANADNHFGYGLIAQAAGFEESARKAFERAVSLVPNHWEAHLALARLYLHQNQWDQAARHIDTVLKAEPLNDEALELRAIVQGRGIPQQN